MRIPIVPARRESQTGVDIALGEVGQGDALEGQIGSHLGDNVHDDPNNHHHAQVTQPEGRRACDIEDSTRADEETSTDTEVWNCDISDGCLRLERVRTRTLHPMPGIEYGDSSIHAEVGFRG